MFFSVKIQENETLRVGFYSRCLADWLNECIFLSISFVFACMRLFSSDICFLVSRCFKRKKNCFLYLIACELRLFLIAFTFDDEKQCCKLHYHASISRFDLRLNFVRLLFLWFRIAIAAVSTSAKKILSDYTFHD